LFAARDSTAFVLLFSVDASAPSESYTLSLHDALPICAPRGDGCLRGDARHGRLPREPDSRVDEGVEDVHDQVDADDHEPGRGHRSEEHTSELQSPDHLVCRLLLEKQKKKKYQTLTLEQ